MKTLIKILIVLAAFCLIGCLPEEETKTPEVKPIPVKVETIVHTDLPVVVKAVGRLSANREVTLAAEVAGVIKAYSADVGDVVEKDRELVLLDETDFRLSLNEARAGEASARAGLGASARTYTRMKNLLPRKVVTRDRFDQVQAEYRSASAAVQRAKAVVDIAEERLKKTRVKAPFKGAVAARSIEIGQMISPGQPLITLVDLSVVRIIIYLVERDFVELDPDDPVTVVVDAYPDRTFKGRVGRIGVKADPATNTFEAEILVDNPDDLLKAGLTARVHCTTSVAKEVVLISQATVLYREDREEVFVVEHESDVARPRVIKLGRAVGDRVRVVDGLKPGDRMVVTGGQYLKDGDKVLIAGEPQKKNEGS